MNTYSDWTVLHIPHDSKVIPADIRNHFMLTDNELNNELLRMTDDHTKELFTSGCNTCKISYASVSRLVVDVERFFNDSKESSTIAVNIL